MKYGKAIFAERSCILSLVVFCGVSLAPASASGCEQHNRVWTIRLAVAAELEGKSGPVLMNSACRGSSGPHRAQGNVRQANSLKTGHSRKDFDALIIASSLRHGLDPALLKAVIHAESNFRADAVSPKGAIGLAQIMPTTAIALGLNKDELWIASKNIDAGARYLSQNLTRFNSLKRALVAYNAGPGVAHQISHTDDMNKIPVETSRYIRRVLALYGQYKDKDFGKRS